MISSDLITNGATIITSIGGAFGVLGAGFKYILDRSDKRMDAMVSAKTQGYQDRIKDLQDNYIRMIEQIKNLQNQIIQLQSVNNFQAIYIGKLETVLHDHNIDLPQRYSNLVEDKAYSISQPLNKPSDLTNGTSS